LITSFFRDGGGTYLDIGANIGLTTIPVAANFKVKCYSFEPDPDNFGFLVLNVRENCRHDNVSAFPLALSDFDGQIQLEKSHNNLGDHRVRPHSAKQGRFGEQDRKVINVKCSKLDSLALQIVPPLFVKIDVQGAEPLVILGGSKTLSRADVMLMEWSPYQMHVMGTDPIAALDFLRNSFTYGAINDNPEYLGWDNLAERPIAEVCGMLSENAISLRDKPFKYFDLLLKR
jgi:FkbM family methyltransferase